MGGKGDCIKLLLGERTRPYVLLLVLLHVEGSLMQLLSSSPPLLLPPGTFADNGADKEVENDMGDSPAKMAEMMGSPEVKAFF